TPPELIVESPASWAACSLGGCWPDGSRNGLLKSTPPKSSPTGGKMMSFTSELTTAARATPRMNARASASTFALSRKVLNSENIARNLHPYVRLARGNQHAGCQGHGQVSSVTTLTATAPPW